MDAPKPKRTYAKHPRPAAGTFGAELRAARRAAGKTQLEILLALKLSKAYLSAVENGRDSRGARVPSHEMCVRLAGAVGAGPDEVRRLCGLAAAQRRAGRRGRLARLKAEVASLRAELAARDAEILALRGRIARGSGSA